MTDIYFLSNGRNVKIGRSKNIEERISNLQTGNDVELTLLYVIEKVSEKFEQHVHSICERYHVKGEWFDNKAIHHLLDHPWYIKNMKKIDKKISI